MPKPFRRLTTRRKYEFLMLITVFYDAKVRYLFYLVNTPPKIIYFYYIIMPQKHYLVFLRGDSGMGRGGERRENGAATEKD